MKALTREDLLYILQGVFHLSDEQNNAFQLLDDGLFVQDYKPDLKKHAEDNDLHVDAALKKMLSGFSLNEDGKLTYNGEIVLIPQDIYEHLINNDIHVTLKDKESWDAMLEAAKTFTNEELGKLTFIDMTEVEKLPEEHEVSTKTIYLLKDKENATEECEDVMYFYINGRWLQLSISNKTLKKLTTKKEFEEYIEKEKHENRDVLDKLTESDSDGLLFDGKSVHQFEISDAPGNAAIVKDGKLYVKDLEATVRSLQISAVLSKSLLWYGDIEDSGRYDLMDSIDNYSMLVIDYYYQPHDPEKEKGNAKSTIIDVDTLNELYERNIDYLLEMGYGLMTSNCKIRFNKSTLWVNYYHNVCIYKITGIGGVGNE